MVRTPMPVLDAPKAAACCAPIASADLTDEEAEATATLFRALGDANRVRIMNRLATSPVPACACVLNEDLAISQPTMSFHLKKLVDAGILSRERRGVWAYYSIDTEAARRIRGVLELEEEDR